MKTLLPFPLLAAALPAHAQTHVMGGALPIRAVGSLIGAVGVSGAPGGGKDRACAPPRCKKWRNAGIRDPGRPGGASARS